MSRPDQKLSFPCRALPDGSVDCGPPPGVCVVTRCTSAPFDEARDCSIVDGARVCLAPPFACVQQPEPCAQPVPTFTALEILITVFLIAAIGAMVAGARRADKIARAANPQSSPQKDYHV